MKREFPYFQKDGQWFPVVEVNLRRGARSISVKALVDSGASFSLFHPEVAEYLGVPLERGRKIYLTGVGGRVLGYLHTVQLTVGGTRILCKMVFSPEFTVSFNLLGRDNFFIPFTVSFFEKNKKMVLSATR